MIGVSNDTKKGAAMRLTVAIAQKRIRELAKVTENVIFGNHAQQRMQERDLFDVDVLRILRQGYVDDAPSLTEHQEWKCKVTLKFRGGRTAGVVTIFLHNGKLFVKTVEWEHL